MNLPTELILMILKEYKKGLRYRQYCRNRLMLRARLNLPSLVVAWQDQQIWKCGHHEWYIVNDEEEEKVITQLFHLGGNKPFYYFIK